MSTTPPHAMKELSDPLRAPTPETDARVIEFAGHKGKVVFAGFASALEAQRDASLRALEEKNEVLLVAETALERQLAGIKRAFKLVKVSSAMFIELATLEENTRQALARVAQQTSRIRAAKPNASASELNAKKGRDRI